MDRRLGCGRRERRDQLLGPEARLPRYDRGRPPGRAVRVHQPRRGDDRGAPAAPRARLLAARPAAQPVRGAAGPDAGRTGDHGERPRLAGRAGGRGGRGAGPGPLTPLSRGSAGWGVTSLVCRTPPCAAKPLQNEPLGRGSMPIDQAPPAASQVVVTAQLPPAAGDPAFSIVQVDPQVLKVNSRLDEALASVPGFSLFRRTSSLGANPTTQGVSVREIAGSGASRALVTLDRVPQNDPFGGWVIWTGLPPETIGSATVVRGAGSGPYGAGALTGVVALASPTTIGGGVAGGVEGGELGYLRGAGVAEIDTGPASHLFFSASGERSDGWIPVIQGRGSVDRPLSLRDWSASQRFVTELGGGVVLAERVAGYQEDRSAGTLFAGSEASGAQGSVTVAKQPAAGALGWRLDAWASGSNLVNTSASVALNRNS